MRENEKVIGFVPLRSGSKGIPNKNIKSLFGKPLCYHVINSLNNSLNIDKVIISTDSLKIKNIINSFRFDKVKVIARSPESASDYASSEIPLLEFLNNESDIKEKDIIFFAQATSPQLTSDDVDKSLYSFFEKKCDSMLSVVSSFRFYWDDKGNPLNYKPIKRPRRQEMKPTFIENGAFYISSKKNILKSNCRISGKIKYHIMNENTLVEIDELNDFNFIEKNYKI